MQLTKFVPVDVDKIKQFVRFYQLSLNNFIVIQRTFVKDALPNEHVVGVFDSNLVGEARHRLDDRPRLSKAAGMPYSILQYPIAGLLMKHVHSSANGDQLSHGVPILVTVEHTIDVETWVASVSRSSSPTPRPGATPSVQVVGGRSSMLARADAVGYSQFARYTIRGGD